MSQPLVKRENWPERLNDYLCGDHVFEWTTNNCALFAAGAVKAMTGIDFGSDYRGPKTKRGMITRLRRVSGGDVEDAARLHLGEPMDNPLLARRGDVVSVLTADGVALGVCAGARIALLDPENGIVHWPLTAGRLVWRIG